VVATAGLALVTAFALSARLWWAFDLFSHFRLQYALLAASLSLGALAFRAYPIAAVLAAIALVHAWAIKDLWLGGSAAAASEAEPLRVASANVLRSNPEPGKALDFVQTSDAHVVVLVEARASAGGTCWRRLVQTMRIERRRAGRAALPSSCSAAILSSGNPCSARLEAAGPT
jgi:endonuclease/exonuclease/phosphatase (EEP) superfamily protein YafD